MLRQEPLASYTTFRVGGAAEYLIEITQEEEVLPAFDFADANHLPVTILGGGSNVLVSDKGVTGLTIVMRTKGIVWKQDRESIVADVAAGEVWDDFVVECEKKNAWGVENLSAIPGTVGAAPVQNIGAYGTEAGKYIVSVKVFDPTKRAIRYLKHNECEFGYRDSIFKRNPHLLVLSVQFRLSLSGSPNLSYQDLRLWFCEKGHMVPSLSEVRDAVIAIRKKKFPDLSTIGTAGSFFKNPVISRQVFSTIQKKIPDLPHWEQEDGSVKVSAAWLIDHVAKMRGVRHGEVGSWKEQALVIVNYGAANAAEIKNFTKEIADQVFLLTGIMLTSEVVFLGA